MAVPPKFAPSLSRSPDSIIINSSEAAPRPSAANELWEPPTPAEWDRAIRIFALQVVRELAQRSCSLRLLRLLRLPVNWR